MLAAGVRFGPYQIATRLGAGGMGEVYRATDTKLGRDVAIKVLPAELRTTRSASPASSARRSCSRRSTIPHIAHVYGFESAALEDGCAAASVKSVSTTSISRS